VKQQRWEVIIERRIFAHAPSNAQRQRSGLAKEKD
jgi:hypothetical protein